MENQLAELYAEPSGEFDNFVRISRSDFEYLQKISSTVAKKDTDSRDAIQVKVRLAVTLRYLATGDSYRSFHYLFKISSKVISIIVPEVCLALNGVLKDLVKVNHIILIQNIYVLLMKNQQVCLQQRWLLKNKIISEKLIRYLGTFSDIILKINVY